ncbi:hypothetical protein G7Y89_g5983 [Cudoniella acicularis]|uniref:Glycosyltransferase 61 catalytic domain-containing protein n=1 Tax=Cudoniella acicularis TaxID=354080 RepID=A0A8H4RNT1_9HELO|nr:hypothetical protein G7Y89_g5983 [Cudoniella acicularis]
MCVATGVLIDPAREQPKNKTVMNWQLRNFTAEITKDSTKDVNTDTENIRSLSGELCEPCTSDAKWTLLVKREQNDNIWHDLMELWQSMVTLDVLQMAIDPKTTKPYLSAADISDIQVVFTTGDQGFTWPDVIDRKGRRKLRDLDLLVANVQARWPEVKFQIIDLANLIMKEQVTITKQTDVLVGMHGAGLTHLLWLPEEFSLVEIRAPNKRVPVGQPYTVFRNLAKTKNWYYFTAHPEPREGDDWQRVEWVDIKADVFQALIDAAINTQIHKGSSSGEVLLDLHLFTGGLGGIGSEICTSILESGGDVLCLDLPENPNLGESDAVTYPVDAFRKILDVNIMGTFLIVQACAKIMREEGGGSIVMIASMSGTIANKGVHTSAYNASKAAVLQLGRNLAAEWGKESEKEKVIRVNTLSPGYVVTGLTEGAMAREKRMDFSIAESIGVISE